MYTKATDVSVTRTTTPYVPGKTPTVLVSQSIRPVFATIVNPGGIGSPGNGSMENLSFVLSPTLWDGNPITWSQEIGNNAVDVYVPLADDWAINPGSRYLIRLTIDFGWVVPQPGTWTITLINLQGLEVPGALPIVLSGNFPIPPINPE